MVKTVPLIQFKGRHGLRYRISYIIESRIEFNYGIGLAWVFTDHWPLQN